MGDRANVVLTDVDDQVCLYTHGQGYRLPEVVKEALIRGVDRVNDYHYLTRIIFCEMVKGREMSLTGFGISNQIFDGEDRVIFIDVDKQEIKINDKDPVKIADFIAMEEVGW